MHCPSLFPFSPFRTSVIQLFGFGFVLRMSSLQQPPTAEGVSAHGPMSKDACSTCGNDGELRYCSACRNPRTCYCSRACQKTDWKRHQVECRRARDFIDVLAAVEVALFGSMSGEDATDEERLARIASSLGAALVGDGRASVEQRIRNLLRVVALPPVVEIARSSGPRWVAFAPQRCFGSFASLSEAAAALVPVVRAKVRGATPPPGILPPAEPCCCGSYLEAGAAALAVGTHVRPVACAAAGAGLGGGAEADVAMRIPVILPRDDAALKASGLWLAVPARGPSGVETVEQVQVQDLPLWLRRKRTASVWQAHADGSS